MKWRMRRMEIQTEEIIQRYSKELQELLATSNTKIQKFLDHECLKDLGYDMREDCHFYLCLPLDKKEKVIYIKRDLSGETQRFLLEKKPCSSNYNSSTYEIRLDKSQWSCNCQGWITKSRRGEMPPHGIGCSHIKAVLIAMKQGRLEQ